MFIVVLSFDYAGVIKKLNMAAFQVTCKPIHNLQSDIKTRELQ